MVVELLCPVWYLTSTLVAANFLDALLDTQVPDTPQGEERSGNKLRSSQTQSFRMFLKNVNTLFFFFLLQARHLIMHV